jgi:hypothetical protein
MCIWFGDLGTLFTSMLTGGSDCQVGIYDIEEPLIRGRNTVYPMIASLDR